MSDRIHIRVYTNFTCMYFMSKMYYNNYLSVIVLTHYIIDAWIIGGSHTCTCTHERTHVHTQTLIHTHKHGRTHARKHARTHTSTHTCTHTHTHAHTHTHTHTHTYIHKFCVFIEYALVLVYNKINMQKTNLGLQIVCMHGL